MIRLTMVAAGHAEMDRGFSRFANVVGDYSDVWPVVGDTVRGIVKEQFDTQGAAGGDAWAPLQEQYGKWKAVHFPGMPILQRTGTGYRAMTQEGAPGSVFDYNERSMKVGTDLGYLIFHQSRDGRAGRLPRRPIIQFTEAMKRAIFRPMQMYVIQIATQLGFRVNAPGAFRDRAQTKSRFNQLVD
jgi:phage gpG-like protein